MVIQLRARHYDLMGAIFYAKVYANFDNYVLKKQSQKHLLYTFKM